MMGKEKKIMPAMHMRTNSTAPTTGLEKKYRPITSAHVRATSINKMTAATFAKKRLAESASFSDFFIRLFMKS
jgi:hypothetical protein